jgi:hypothetical protein
MLDWIYWPATLLLDMAATLTILFVARDAPGFPVVQMMIATLLLAAIVAVAMYLQLLIEFLRTRRE